MKKHFFVKTIIITAIVFCCLFQRIYTFGAAEGIGSETEEIKTEDPLLYTIYANTYLCLDKFGVVCRNSSSRPEGCPELKGVEFINMTFGSEAEPEDKSALSYVIKVAAGLLKHGIEADVIEYSKRMVTVYIGGIKIQFGKDDKTQEKTDDLADFIDKLDGMQGTLYMQNANANNYGYTFRADD